MQTVLVAGGAGFIGSHLCKKLLKDSYEVICVDNFLTSKKKNVEDQLKDNNFELIEQDISGGVTIEREVNYIFHLASPASPNKRSPRSYINHPIETLLVNSQGTFNLLELARKNNSKFLFASSSEVYGDPSISPQTEEYFGNVNPNGVRSVYDEAKRFGEAITFAFHRKYGLDARIIRIFNTYGPVMMADDGRVVSNLINQAIRNQPLTVYGDGTQTRSFCFVEDMVSGICAAMFNPRAKGEVFNLGNPDERSILEIAKLIKSLAKSKSKIIFDELPLDDPRSRRPEIKKAREILNWEPKISTEEGIKKTIEYFRSL